MSERFKFRGVAAALVFGLTALAPTAADARVGDRRRALERLQVEGVEACNDVHDAVQELRGRELTARLNEIDGDLRESIARHSRALGYGLTEREYANVEVLIRQCYNDAGRYDDLGGNKK